MTNCNSSGPGSLPAVFAAAAQRYTIVFDLDCTGGSTIAVPATLGVDNKRILIDGTGHTIAIDGHDANGLIFSIFEGATLTLTNLTLTESGEVPRKGGPPVRSA